MVIEGYLAKNDYDASVYEWWIKGLRWGEVGARAQLLGFWDNYGYSRT